MTSQDRELQAESHKFTKGLSHWEVSEDPAGFSLFFTLKWVKNTTFQIDIRCKRKYKVNADFVTILNTCI